MSTAFRQPGRGILAPAFTLVEAVVCIVVVGLMLAASLNAAGAAKSRQQFNNDRITGLWLAQSLMAEIVEKQYADAGGLLGLELGENRAVRTTLNDLDDYDGLSESPPRYPDGTAIPGYTNWTRSVSIDNVQTSNPRSKSVSDTLLRRITITVRKNGKPVAELTTLRSKAKDSW